jgi:hypothetical protein
MQLQAGRIAKEVTWYAFSPSYGKVLVVLEPRKAEQITGGRTLDPKVAVRMHNHLASIKLLRDFNSSALIGGAATLPSN